MNCEAIGADIRPQSNTMITIGLGLGYYPAPPGLLSTYPTGCLSSHRTRHQLGQVSLGPVSQWWRLLQGMTRGLPTR